MRPLLIRVLVTSNTCISYCVPPATVGRNDVVVAQVGIHDGRRPCPVEEVLHSMNAVWQVGDGNRRPKSIRAVEKADVDIAGVIRRRFKIPTDLPVVPEIRIDIASGLAVQNVVIQLPPAPDQDDRDRRGTRSFRPDNCPQRRRSISAPLNWSATHPRPPRQNDSSCMPSFVPLQLLPMVICTHRPQFSPLFHIPISAAFGPVVEMGRDSVRV